MGTFGLGGAQEGFIYFSYPVNPKNVEIILFLTTKTLANTLIHDGVLLLLCLRLINLLSHSDSGLL